MQNVIVDQTIFDLVLGELSRDSDFYPWRQSLATNGIGPRVLNHTAKVDSDVLEWTLESDENDLEEDAGRFAEQLKELADSGGLDRKVYLAEIAEILRLLDNC